MPTTDHRKVAKRANNYNFMTTLKHTFELEISEENKWLIPVIAKKFGWIAESGITAEQAIIKHFSDQNEIIRARTMAGLNEYFGEAGKDTVADVMRLYDETLKTTTTFE